LSNMRDHRKATLKRLISKLNLFISRWDLSPAGCYFRLKGK
jgi:hypothetical protein